MKTRYAGDRGYYERHSKRNEKRARSITSSIERDVSTILDVGCNRGYLGGTIMSKFVTAECTGVDIVSNGVNSHLLANPRFSFIQSDVVHFQPIRQYDVVLYCAVHHHIFANHGPEAALAVFARLIKCCNHYFFFETGHLSEGSRWYWHESISKWFSSDEDHIHWLISSLGRHIKKVDCVGAFWIHGTRRWLLRFIVEPPQNVRPENSSECMHVVPSNCQEIESYKSSKKRKHLSKNYKCNIMSSSKQESTPVFIKKWIDGSDTAYIEYDIGCKMPCEGAIRPSALTTDQGLVFPYVHTKPSLPRISQIKQFYQCASESKLDSHYLPKYLPNHRYYRYIDVIDINPSNILSSANDNELCVVDFEYFSPASALRNRRNLGILLFRCGNRLEGGIIWFVAMFAMFARAVVDSFRPPQVRIILKRPGFIGIAYSRFRAYIDRLLGIILPSYLE